MGSAGTVTLFSFGLRFAGWAEAGEAKGAAAPLPPTRAAAEAEEAKAEGVGEEAPPELRLRGERGGAHGWIH